jgi:NADP-dependent 3-hydroxy acid dehydrogenase YdfG
MMTVKLKDRVVLITGATGALGSAIAREFAQTEAQLALTSRSMEALHELVAETNPPEKRVVALWADVT